MMEGIVGAPNTGCLVTQHPRGNVAVQAFFRVGLPAQRHVMDEDRRKHDY